MTDTHSSPRTLRAFAGLPEKPGDPRDCVLLMIDPQREYTTGALPLADIEAAVEEGTRLLAFARERGIPVIHAIHHGRAGGGLFEPLGDGAKFIDALAPRAGEAVIVKHLPNAFAATDLATRLREMGRKEIVIGGFATHMCVSATARSAVDHGFRTTVVARATATRDLPDAMGAGVTSAAVVQAGTLAALADRFSVVVRDTGAWMSWPAR